MVVVAVAWAVWAGWVEWICDARGHCHPDASQDPSCGRDCTDLVGVGFRDPFTRSDFLGEQNA